MSTTRTALLQVEHAARLLLQACAALRESLPHGQNVATIESIISAVAEDFGYTFLLMRARDRHARIALARQTGLYLARELTGASLIELGNVLERDHGTVIHAIRAVDERMATDPLFAQRVARLRGKLTEARLAA